MMVNYHSSFKRKIADYINKWEKRGYDGAVPDEADQNLEDLVKAPSYRAICVTILKNDNQCAYLGYSRPKTVAYMSLKQIEIAERTKK
jgi:predicted phosphoadenosine phosphosulfate sulfurtransferase